MSTFDIEEAIYSAAGAGNDAQSFGGAGVFTPASTSSKRVAMAREVLRRFLELAPEDATVADLREMMG